MLEILATLAVAIYGVGPLVVWLTLSQRVPATIESAGPEHNGTFDKLRHTAAPLEAAGFVELGQYLHGSVANPVPFLLLKDRESTTSCILAQFSTGPMTEFASRSTDGNYFLTNDSSMVLPVLGHPSSKQLRQFPEMSMQELYDAHRMLVRSELGSDLQPVRSAEQAIAEIAEYEELEAQFHADQGWAKLREDTKRLTLLGAYLMSWRVSWPMKPIRRQLARRRHGEALASARLAIENRHQV